MRRESIASAEYYPYGWALDVLNGLRVREGIPILKDALSTDYEYDAIKAADLLLALHEEEPVEGIDALLPDLFDRLQGCLVGRFPRPEWTPGRSDGD